MFIGKLNKTVNEIFIRERKFNKRIRFLLCVISIFTKYTWVIPLKDEIGITATNAFQNILDESNRKPTRYW